MKRQLITKSVTEFIKSAGQYTEDDLVNIITIAQITNNFRLWHFDLESNLRVYFPQNDLTDSNYEDLMGNHLIPKITFESAAAFVEFVLKNFQYEEILLSTDEMIDMYQKHANNINSMHEIAKKQLEFSRLAKNTEAKKVRRAENRLAQKEAGTLNTSRPNVAETANLEYMTQCKV